jgi:hypothetical protein
VSTLLARVPLEQIRTEAKAARFLPTLLAFVTAILFGVGWLIGKVFSVVWFVLAYAGTAVKVGFIQARSPKAGDG